MNQRRHSIAQRVARRVHETLDTDRIQKLRKDFLMLTRNIPKLKSYRQAVDLKKALKKWNEHFYSLIYGKLAPKLKEMGNLNTEKQLRETAWDLHLALGEMPLRQDRIGDSYWNWTKERAFEDFLKERDAWFNRMRRYARKVWKELDNVVEYASEDISFSHSVPDQVEIEGFKIVIEGFDDDPSDFWKKVWNEKFSQLRHALKVYKKRAAKTLPALLRQQLPLIIQADRSLGQPFAEYHHSKKIITIHPTAGDGSTGRFVQVLAHEMAHHLWQSELSGDARSFWQTAYTASNKKLDLRDVVTMWPEGMTRSQFDAMLKKIDSELFIQLESLHFQRSKVKDLLYREEFEDYIQNNDPIVTVRSGFPTGYSGKNAQEAFCEVVGMLVAYGPKTVPEAGIRLIKTILPQIKLSFLPKV